MTKRLVVLYIPTPSAANPKPVEQLVYRGGASTFALMWQKCAEKLPTDLMRVNGSGVVLVGREGDTWIENPSPHSPAAKPWHGSEKSGSIMEFLRVQTMLYFPDAEVSSAQVAETATA